MQGLVTGKRPDITPAQIVAGLPIVANLLAAFNVYHASPAQIDALQTAGAWALGLLGADAVIRIGRSLADAKRDAAALAPATQPPDVVHGAPEGPVEDPEAEDLPVTSLPSDSEEFAAPPPDALDDEPSDPAVVQPSQQLNTGTTPPAT